MKKILMIAFALIGLSFLNPQKAEAAPTLTGDQVNKAIQFVNTNFPGHNWAIIKRLNTGTPHLVILPTSASSSFNNSTSATNAPEGHWGISLNTQSGNQLIFQSANIASGSPLCSTGQFRFNYAMNEWGVDNSGDPTCTTDATSARALANTMYIGDQIISTVPLAYDNTATTSFAGGFTDCDGTCSQGEVVYGTVYEEPEPEALPLTGAFYINYRDPAYAGSFVILYSDARCVMEEMSSATSHEIYCDDPWRLYLNHAGLISEITDSVSQPSSLSTPNAPTEYCDQIWKSNYALFDENDDPVCKATSNKTIEDLIKPYQPIIDFDPGDYDWGAFDWFKEPFAILIDIINSIAEWFYDIWASFLNVIIPNPESLQWFIGSIKSKINNKFSQIDITTFSNFKDLSALEPSNVTTNLFGVSVPLINFDLIKEHIGLIRPVLIAGIGLFLILFNVNQLNKVLQDTSVT